MTDAPRLTDMAALSRNRRRAQTPALFLHDTAIDEVQDRLSMVNRTFRDIAIVTGFPGPWGIAFAQAQLVPEAETLSLAPGQCDLVIHAMGLHWANDPVGQIIQCRRALRPDGLFLAVCFGGQTLAQLRTAWAEAESRLTGGMAPRVAPMAEIRDLGGLLQRAGLALPVADTLVLQASYASPRALMRELRHMGEANALAHRLRRPTRRAVLQGAETLYRQMAGTPDGRVGATFELLFLTAWAPDASQPQPLRPGSAQKRLADALGTDETPLAD